MVERDDMAAEAAAEEEHAIARAALKRRSRLGLLFWLPAAWLALVAGLAICAPILPIPPLDEADFLSLQAPPSAEHPFGTDVLGRSMLSRTVNGARISLTVGFSAPAVGLLFGFFLGVSAGYFRGRLDDVIGTAIDSWLAFPGLVILLLFSVTFGGSLHTVSFALGLLFIPAAARITRATTLAFVEREFVLAARAMGATDVRIIALEIFPNIIWPIITYILIAVPIAIVAEGALSFLGLSVASPTPSWGGMIAEGREHLEETPHISLIPTAIMFLTVLSFNLVGDTIRRRFSDIRESAIG